MSGGAPRARVKANYCAVPNLACIPSGLWPQRPPWTAIACSRPCRGHRRTARCGDRPPIAGRRRGACQSTDRDARAGRLVPRFDREGCAPRHREAQRAEPGGGRGSRGGGRQAAFRHACVENCFVVGQKVALVDHPSERTEPVLKLCLVADVGDCPGRLIFPSEAAELHLESTVDPLDAVLGQALDRIFAVDASGHDALISQALQIRLCAFSLLRRCRLRARAGAVACCPDNQTTDREQCDPCPWASLGRWWHGAWRHGHLLRVATVWTCSRLAAQLSAAFFALDQRHCSSISFLVGRVRARAQPIDRTRMPPCPAQKSGGDSSGRLRS